MNKYTLTEEEVSKLFQALEVTKKGLPFSTAISASDCSISIHAIQDTMNLLVKQNEEFIAAHNENNKKAQDNGAIDQQVSQPRKSPVKRQPRKTS